MNVLVTGSRKWTDFEAIYERLSKLPKDTVIIEGGANGADILAGTAACSLKLKRIVVRADWDSFGKGAGAIRNRMMLGMDIDLVLGFRINNSAGTTDCIDEAQRRGIPVEVLDR